MESLEESDATSRLSGFSYLQWYFHIPTRDSDVAKQVAASPSRRRDELSRGPAVMPDLLQAIDGPSCVLVRIVKF